MKKTCFVIMPFGEKTDPDGRVIDFDDIYEFMIRGAVEEDLQLECIRCDKIPGAGVIHRDMIQQILDADVAVVDITTTNPNVYYELGVRHALKKCVTVVIRRQGTNLPFNIRDLRVIDYDPSRAMSMRTCRDTIKKFVEVGLKTLANDSLVHQFVDVRVEPPSVQASEPAQVFLLGTGPARLELHSGDLEQIQGIDIWVNSENTNMQMARFYDSAISALIRFLGATKTDIGNVAEDKIAKALAELMAGKEVVPPGAVLVTTAGELEASNKVRALFHAASVQGAVGKGYAPIPNLEKCVRNALVQADKHEKAKGCTSILFPLLGAGTAKGNAEANFRLMVREAVKYLTDTPNTAVKRVCFLAYSVSDWRTCMNVLRQNSALSPA